MTGLSVLVPTLNEELNLAACLESVAWADEIFVVDSFSTDATLEIARRYTDRVYQHAFVNYSLQKNWALDTLPFAHEWVLILDADERVTPELRQEIQQTLARPDACDGYYLNRRFYFLGRWIRHCGWYPSWNLRLFKHALGRYDQREVHEHLVLRGRVGYLKHDLIHEDRRPLEAFLARHNRYSSLEAKARLKAERNRQATALRASPFGGPVERKRWLRERVWPRLPLKPALLFLYMYLVRAGFLDGPEGLAFCLFHAFQEFTVGLKLRELRAREGQAAG